MSVPKGSENTKSKIHRTSSTRKARRKNEFTGDWADFKRQSLSDNTSGSKVWSKKNVKIWVGNHFTQLTAVLIAIGWAIWYFWYASVLFENATRFSHLTNLERELSLPTDVAFRYSFFKKIATAEGYMDGLRLITRDYQNEKVPPIANSFHRHSLSPE
ncbi:unnamed protein product [Allacma fusca]|uniref:Uncharacterized protein n=1 Tax=Allacma fusca TaxID=39272 RepID=A0A8J2PLC8_9HEXA|nr:unnamed protein product [Allacma fusca]